MSGRGSPLSREDADDIGYRTITLREDDEFYKAYVRGDLRRLRNDSPNLHGFVSEKKQDATLNNHGLDGLTSKFGDSVQADGVNVT